MIDLLIKNANIVDGTGASAYAGSVAVEGDKIVAVIKDGPLPEAKTVIDAEGCLLTPGFIDIHSHADGSLLRDSQEDNMIVQGITTHVSGNCGISLAPATNQEYVDGRLFPRWKKFWRWTTPISTEPSEIPVFCALPDSFVF